MNVAVIDGLIGQPVKFQTPGDPGYGVILAVAYDQSRETHGANFVFLIADAEMKLYRHGISEIEFQGDLSKQVLPALKSITQSA